MPKKATKNKKEEPDEDMIEENEDLGDMYDEGQDEENEDEADEDNDLE